MEKLKISNDTVEITLEDFKNIKTVLEKSQLSIFNSEIISEFQEDFFNFICKNKKQDGGVIALPNCTTAIFISLQLLNLKEDDEIIVPNLTHSSSIYPILHIHGCKIKICDFSVNSYDLDIKHLKTLISSKTKAIIVCYFHGYPNNIEDISKICREKNIKLIEDCAQGLGMTIGKKSAGNIGDYSCFSFGENKLLKMGEGGALKFNNKNEEEEINKIRHVGEVWKKTGKSTVTNEITYGDLIYTGIDYRGLGFNYRVNPLSIALGIDKLNRLDEIIKVRQKKLEIYKNKLNGIKGIKLMCDNIKITSPISAWYIVDSKKFDINKIILKCLEYGIPIGKFKYSKISDINVFKQYILNKDDDFSNSDYLQKNSLFFSVYENISFNDIEKICEYLKEIFLNYDKLNINQKILDRKIEYFDGFFIK